MSAESKRVLGKMPNIDNLANAQEMARALANQVETAEAEIERLRHERAVVRELLPNTMAVHEESKAFREALAYMANHGCTFPPCKSANADADRDDICLACYAKRVLDVGGAK